MKFNYVAESTGNTLELEVEFKRVDPKSLHQFLADPKDRNGLCTQGGKKSCAKYNTRPCCPPNLKMFDEFPQKKYLYLIKVTTTLTDYCRYSEKTAESDRKNFLFMNIGHVITRNVVNRTVNQFKGQGFRVGGCLGCTYHKDQRCKKFMPPLEGTGLILDDVVQNVFGSEIEWATTGEPLELMTALGAIMTDEEISKARLIEAIKISCNIK